jgi:hypothetical protein
MLMKHGCKVLQIGMIQKASRKLLKDQELGCCLELEKVDIEKDEKVLMKMQDPRSCAVKGGKKEGDQNSKLG